MTYKITISEAKKAGTKLNLSQLWTEQAKWLAIGVKDYRWH